MCHCVGERAKVRGWELAQPEREEGLLETIKEQKMYHYEVGYMQCPTGVFKLNGTVPQYLTEILFEDEASVRQALTEARKVLVEGIDGTGVMAVLYASGKRRVSMIDLHEAWRVALDAMSEPLF